MLRPRHPDSRQLAIGNTCNIGQLIDIVFKYLECFVAKVPDDFLSCFRAYTLYQARTQVFFYGCNSGGFTFICLSGLKLTTVFLVVYPAAAKHHCRTGEYTRLMHGNRFLLPRRINRLHAQHRPSGNRIVVGNPVDDTG